MYLLVRVKAAKAKLNKEVLKMLLMGFLNGAAKKTNN
jgi:hypothetical protein